MAIGGKAQTGLEYVLSARGAEQVVGQIGRVNGAISGAGRATGTFTGKMSAGLGRLSGMAGGLFRQFSQLGAMLGVGFGAAGLVMLGKEIIGFDTGLRSVAHQAGLSNAEMEALGKSVTGMATRIGRSRDELMTAVDTANDFGLSVDEAAAVMERTALWAQLVGVDLGRAVTAVGGLSRAVKGTVPPDELLSMLDAAAKLSGTSEEMFIDVVARIAPQLEGIKGADDLTAMFQVLGGLGEQFAAEPEKLKMAFQGMEKELIKMGRAGENPAIALMNLAAQVGDDTEELAKLPISEEIKTMIAKLASPEAREAMRRMGASVAGAGGNAAELGVKLDEFAKGPAVTFAATLEQFKAAMRPIVEDLLASIIANKEEIKGAFLSLIDGIKTLGGAIKWLLEKLGIKGTESTEAVRADVTEKMGGGLGAHAATAITDMMLGKQGLERLRAVGEAPTAGTTTKAIGANLLQMFGFGQAAEDLSRSMGVTSPAGAHQQHDPNRPWYSYVGQALDPSAYLPTAGGATGRAVGWGRGGGGEQRPILIRVERGVEARVEADRADRTVQQIGG